MQCSSRWLWVSAWLPVLQHDLLGLGTDCLLMEGRSEGVSKRIAAPQSSKAIEDSAHAQSYQCACSDKHTYVPRR